MKQNMMYLVLDISSNSTIKDTPAPLILHHLILLVDINRLDLKYTPNTVTKPLSSVGVKVPSFEYKGRGTYNITGDKFHTLFDVSMLKLAHKSQVVSY